MTMEDFRLWYPSPEEEKAYRVDFEAWAAESINTNLAREPKAPTIYINPFVQVAWEGYLRAKFSGACPTCGSKWKAVRKTLPHPTEDAACFDPWHSA
jgi:hypothetical protein